MQFQKVLNNLIGGIARTQRSIGRGASGNIGDGNDTYRFALPLIIEEEESSVFDDWSAERDSILIVMKWRFRVWSSNISRNGIEIVARIEGIIAEVVSGGPVE